MSRTTVSEVLARANAAMVEPDHDITGAIATILVGATEALPAAAAAILVDVEGVLEVLASTSHRATDLEVLQQQLDQGPCLDALSTGEVVAASGSEELFERWPEAGAAIDRAGYHSLLATPLRWQGHTFGAFNVFRTEPTAFESERSGCRALADAATLVLVTSHLDAPRVADGLRSALEERAIIEQAKGALAHTHSLGMAAAFDELLDIAHTDGTTLGVTAHRVMARARTGRLGRA